MDKRDLGNKKNINESNKVIRKKGIRKEGTNVSDNKRLIEREKNEPLRRNNRKKVKKKSRRKAILRLFVGLIILILTILIIIATIMLSYLTGFSKSDLEDGVKPEANKPLNVLILGMDVGDIEQDNNEALKRADTIMVLNYNPKTDKINLVSIPRDTLIEVDAYDEYGNLISYWKINSAYSLGGHQEMIKHVEEILKVPINYTVKVSYNAFREFINSIGGVEMYIEQDMHYDDEGQDLHINFNEGETLLLDGKAAEEFFRWRKNNDGSGFIDGDLGRIQNQQKLMRKVLNKCMTPSIVFKSKEILNSVQKNIATNMPIKDMIYYALKMIKNKGISMHTIQGYNETIYEQSYLVPDEELNRELISLLRAETDKQLINKEDFKILILNGTRISGLAASLQKDMENIGYEIFETGNSERVEESLILTDNKELKEQLRLDVGISNFKKNTSEYVRYDAVIILGDDFREFGE